VFHFPILIVLILWFDLTAPQWGYGQQPFRGYPMPQYDESGMYVVDPNQAAFFGYPPAGPYAQYARMVRSHDE
jgi:hypothetical protein